MGTIKNTSSGGERPLFAARDLCLENCTMAEDCDLAFEYLTVGTTIDGAVRSVKNPRSGSITAERYGDIILDEHGKAPSDCVIKLWDERTCFSA